MEFRWDGKGRGYWSHGLWVRCGPGYQGRRVWGRECHLKRGLRGGGGDQSCRHWSCRRHQNCWWNGCGRRQGRGIRCGPRYKGRWFGCGSCGQHDQGCDSGGRKQGKFVSVLKALSVTMLQILSECEVKVQTMRKFKN